MDPVKEAFLKIKDDIQNLQLEISQIKAELFKQNNINPTIQQVTSPQHIQQTNQQTHLTDKPTQNIALGGLKTPNYQFSTGNKGVPTDKQTNGQTDQQAEIHRNSQQDNNNIEQNAFSEADKIMSSLNELREEIKIKFKSLTPQEMLVFSTIYGFQEQNVQITYKTIAEHLNLSESSIRDYINRLISKQVPLNKEKINNKLVLLSIDSSLTKNISLSTIISLRNL
jgi:DNA-binding MarR family transcriptional regulator